MSQDEVNLYNLALSIAGARSRISSPTEQSREAELCRLWYEPVRRQVLRAAPWAAARAQARLALKTERLVETWIAGDPNPEYRYAYALPLRYLQARYLIDYSRFDVSLLSENENALMTNSENAILYYTFDQTQIAMWSSDLFLSIAHALGAYICLPLNGKAQMAARAQAQANALILSSREQAANESYEPLEVSPDWIAARGSIYSTPTARYIYSAGPMISVQNV